jgi:hypothetical protein
VKTKKNTPDQRTWDLGKLYLRETINDMEDKKSNGRGAQVSIQHSHDGPGIEGA